MVVQKNLNNLLNAYKFFVMFKEKLYRVPGFKIFHWDFSSFFINSCKKKEKVILSRCQGNLEKKCLCNILYLLKLWRKKKHV